MRAKVIAYGLTARVAVGFDLDVRVAAALVCQRRFRFEDNSGDLVIPLRGMNVLGRTHF